MRLHSKHDVKKQGSVCELSCFILRGSVELLKMLHLALLVYLYKAFYRRCIPASFYAIRYYAN